MIAEDPVKDHQAISLTWAERVSLVQDCVRLQALLLISTLRTTTNASAKVW